MISILNTNKLSSTESVDIIVKIVYDYLKPFGFRKHGRTLHRFVDGDISQVVNFQNGSPPNIHGILWVNLGIRVPECEEKKFAINESIKKFYHEYECNIRTRLGVLVDKKDTYYNLKGDPKKIANDIVKRIEKYVMPVFERLNNRDNILKYRAEYKDFDLFSSRLIKLEEAMIFGRRGDLVEASRLFNNYYCDALNEYNRDFEYGTQTYLNKGERVTYLNTKTGDVETITASKNGYVTTYNANRGHIDYLEALAKELGVEIIQKTV